MSSEYEWDRKNREAADRSGAHYLAPDNAPPEGLTKPSRVQGNTSGLEPAGRAVLVRPYEAEEAKGTIVMPDSVKSTMQMVEQRAVVVAIGENAWHDEPSARAVVGDHVLITRYAGFIAKAPITADGEEYRLVNDRDIFCRLRR